MLNVSSEILPPITTEEVLKSCKKMKNGEDGITVEMLRYGGEGLLESLAYLYKGLEQSITIQEGDKRKLKPIDQSVFYQPCINCLLKSQHTA